MGFTGIGCTGSLTLCTVHNFLSSFDFHLILAVFELNPVWFHLAFLGLNSAGPKYFLKVGKLLVRSQVTEPGASGLVPCHADFVVHSVQPGVLVQVRCSAASAEIPRPEMATTSCSVLFPCCQQGEALVLGLALVMFCILSCCSSENYRPLNCYHSIMQQNTAWQIGFSYNGMRGLRWVTTSVVLLI